MVEAILLQEWRELDEMELTYQSEKMLTMLGLHYDRHKMSERYLESRFRNQFVILRLT
jgi:hypothetical protein